MGRGGGGGWRVGGFGVRQEQIGKILAQCPEKLGILPVLALFSTGLSNGLSTTIKSYF